jgi:ATP-dependent protease ClpP protease subunit
MPELYTIHWSQEDGKQNNCYVYLCCEISDEVQDYVDLFQTFETAQEGDIIHLYINSGGGAVATASQILSNIQRTEAKVIGYAEGDVYSSAAMIFLACDDWVISDYYAVFLFHPYSGGSTGNAQEWADHFKFFIPHLNKLYKTTHIPVLTEEEVNAILENGRNFIFDKEEMLPRLERLKKFREDKCLV